MVNWIKRAGNLNIKIQNFVNGQYSSGRDFESFTKYSPRDGSRLYEVPCGHRDDANEAVSVARAAFVSGSWAQKSASDRKAILLNFASLMESNSEELALLESLDVGRPITQALQGSVPRAISVIRYNAEAVDKLTDSVHRYGNESLIYGLRHPIGVVVGIIAWNAPVNLAAMKIGPALAMGNSLILKPSELASLSTARLAELAVEAGVPPGVFNVVHGLGSTVGSTLAHHHDVDLLTFTGSTQTGKDLLVAAGQSNMKKVILECGGKSPSLVFDDYPDMDVAASAVVASAFGNQGQTCSAGTRLLIQDSIKDEFVSKVIERASQLAPADPLRSGTKFGALNSYNHMKNVLTYIEEAKAEGADLVCGGERVTIENSAGYYIPPTIFDNVRTDQKIAQEEIFGPVLAIISFSNEDEAIELANNTAFGLAASAWTADVARAHRLVREIQVGGTVIQTSSRASSMPDFGSIPVEPHKQSGLGVEMGVEGLKSYSINFTGIIST